MVLLAAWLAMRFGELTELRRKDVDLSAEVVRVRRAVVRTDDGFVVTTPKSDAGIRDIAIPPHLLPAIENHLAKNVGSKADSLLFSAVGGGHLAPATLYRRFYTARAEANRDDLRWHDLRHSGAVLAAATGATLAELMARLGHSTPQAAMCYQHAAEGRPALHIGANASRAGLVLLAIGSGTDPFAVTPEFAIELAGQLLDAATAAPDAEAHAHESG